jgi:mannose-6-phosphate isomerase-like protein (cupin superfamily)
VLLRVRFVFLFACAPAPRISLQYGTELKQAEIEKVLADNPLGAGESIKITTLGQGQGVSHHLVQVRDREKPHIHKMHDGTVVMVKGRGYIMMDNRRIDLSSADIVYIPRGVGSLLC